MQAVCGRESEWDGETCGAAEGRRIGGEGGGAESSGGEKKKKFERRRERFPVGRLVGEGTSERRLRSGGRKRTNVCARGDFTAAGESLGTRLPPVCVVGRIT